LGLPLPTLDDRTFADLTDESIALIPVLDPAWNNYNPSDPGITLIELFCWLTEMLIFSLDQITDQHRITFLRLINGPGWRPTRPLEEEISSSLALIRGRFRAVTAEDHEALALAASPCVKRARCVPRRNLAAGTEALRRTDAAGHVSVVILALGTDVDQSALCADVRNALEPARILTTRLHVVPPTWVRIMTRMVVVRHSDVPEAAVAEAVQRRLAAWLDPFTGGNGNGWAFGRDIYVAELYAIVEHVAGVDYLGEVTMASTDPDLLQPTAAPIWHDDGDLVGLALAPNELPRAPLAAHQVVVARALAPVRIVVTATPISGASPPSVRRAVKQALKDWLWSLQTEAAHEQKGFTLTVTDIRTALLDAGSVTAVASAIGPVTLHVDPAHLTPPPSGGGDPVSQFDSGEFLEVSCRVDIAWPAAQ
jgi:Baseplate J-like protein